MALDYLRHSSISVPDCETATQSAGKGSAKNKLPKGKFSLLLSGNLLVWVIFAVAVLDIDVFSMHGISVPHIPQKLAVSGIVYNEKSPSAIISKKVYGVGDVVDGYAIIRISRSEVEFEKNGKKLIRKTQ
jgi:hypothetical protein